jgi:hypothetical protein
MAGNDEDRCRNRRLGAEDWGRSGTSWVLGGRKIRRLGAAVCDPHHTHGGDEKRGFSGLASKPVAMGCQWVGLETTVTISWFGPRNQVGGGLSICASKPTSG